jgi:hypothetical protein
MVVAFDARTLRDYYDHGRPQWGEVATYLRSSVRDGDHVVAANGWVFRNLGYYWTDQRLGLAGVPLEHSGLEVAGPSWIVMAVCPVDPDVQVQVERLPLVRGFPTTNHCEIRFLPRGQRISMPRGFCSKDI